MTTETSKPTKHDWVEDWADDDNGQYQHQCSQCGANFLCHKRRVGDCKSCTIDAILRERDEARAELVEVYEDLLHEIGHWNEDKKSWDTGARSTAVHAGDRLVQLGAYTTDESEGYGRMQFYRKKEAAEAARDNA